MRSCSACRAVVSARSSGQKPSRVSLWADVLTEAMLSSSKFFCSDAALAAGVGLWGGGGGHDRTIY